MADVYLDKGRIFRLAFGPSVRKGSWYLGVVCQGCKKPILLLEDASKGGVAPNFLGEGKLSIPCEPCGTDTFYQGMDVKQFKAIRSAKSFRDRRPTPTGSPRQPLLPKYNGAKPTFGIGAIEQRPEVAQVIARCIAYWTDVEAQLARLLATIMKANSEPAIAVYLSLRMARAKSDAMDAAAKLTLAPADYELFLALMAYKASVEKDRTDLAHGMFGVASAIKTGIVWVDTTKYAQYGAHTGLHGVTEKLHEQFLKNCFVMR